MSTPIAVIAETSSEEIRPVTYEVIACAEQIASYTGGGIRIYVPGQDPAAAAEAISRHAPYPVIGIAVETLAGYNHETYRAVLAQVLSEADPAHVCIAHTAKGNDYAPALAAGLNGTCITGVEKVEYNESGLLFARSVLNGKRVARIRAVSHPAVITVSPGMFSPKKQMSPKPSWQTTSLSYSPQRIKRLGVKPAAADTGDLNAADVIVAAGNGVGDEENIDNVKRLAAQFPRSTVAGSRPVCDKHWLPYKCQVGVTGAVVRPRLYIACGISGASQHVAGIREAGLIVAINRDPKAAIFNSADVCIVEDLNTFLPLLTERLGQDLSTDGH